MTNRKWIPNSEADVVSELYRRIAAVETYANDLARQVANLDTPHPLARVDPVSYLTPYEGQRAIDPADEQHMWYSNGQWRKAGGVGLYEIKVFEDDVIVTTEEPFYWPIPEDLDGAEIVYVDGGVSTASSSGPIEVDILHHVGGASGGASFLTSNLSIPAGDNNASAPATISGGVHGPVAGGSPDSDWLQINVDAAGAGAMGLAIMVGFLPSPLGSVAVQGAQGPPGGVIGWTGTWTGNSAAATGSWTTATGYTAGDVVVHGGTFYVATANHTSGASTEPGVGASWETVWSVVTYTEGQAVSNNGSTYVAIVDHTATTASEPGVGANWEDFWMLLSESNRFGALECIINGNAYVLDTGTKAYMTIPFDCTLVEATLLADAAGSVVVDIWKDTYGSFPPTDADSITSASPLTLSGAVKTTNTTLTGWTTSFSEGDVLAFNIDSCSLITRLTIALRVERL